MSNQWVEHVRKYAKANNITYMCAITEASKTYKKDDKLKSTPKTTPVEHKQYNLRPLISKREKELNEMKKRELIALLPAKLKSLNKEQLVNEVLKQENIQVGVKDLENWEYQDLQKAHICLELIKGYKQKLPIFKNELKKRQGASKNADGRRSVGITTNAIRHIEDKIQECEASLLRWNNFKV